MVPKHTRRLAGFDEAVISLYAKGMTTGDIVNHLSDVYGDEVTVRPADVWVLDNVAMGEPAKGTIQ